MSKSNGNTTPNKPTSGNTIAGSMVKLMIENAEAANKGKGTGKN